MKIKSILIIILCFVGAAPISAAPTEVEQRVEYATSLNTMASTIMNWYGSLIEPDQKNSFADVDKQWDEYRSLYPRGISQIQITSTDLIKLEQAHSYQFTVESLINYGANGQLMTSKHREQFIFHVDLFSEAHIEAVIRDTVKESQAVELQGKGRFYYKIRQFSYAWLAYLDGVEGREFELSQGHEPALYTLKIGSKEIQGTLLSTLAERQQFLAKGGHVLRQLEVRSIDEKSNIVTIELIAEWKGLNHIAKPVLAKIQQEIKVKMSDDQLWQIRAIKEQHLLPDIAPWIGLLC